MLGSSPSVSIFPIRTALWAKWRHPCRGIDRIRRASTLQRASHRRRSAASARQHQGGETADTHAEDRDGCDPPSPEVGTRETSVCEMRIGRLLLLVRYIKAKERCGRLAAFTQEVLQARWRRGTRAQISPHIRETITNEGCDSRTGRNASRAQRFKYRAQALFKPGEGATRSTGGESGTCLGRNRPSRDHPTDAQTSRTRYTAAIWKSVKMVKLNANS
jgi:hypothetical protein